MRKKWTVLCPREEGNTASGPLNSWYSWQHSGPIQIPKTFSNQKINTDHAHICLGVASGVFYGVRVVTRNILRTEVVLPIFWANL